MTTNGGSRTPDLTGFDNDLDNIKVSPDFKTSTVDFIQANGTCLRQEILP